MDEKKESAKTLGGAALSQSNKNSSFQDSVEPANIRENDLSSSADSCLDLLIPTLSPYLKGLGQSYGDQSFAMALSGILLTCSATQIDARTRLAVPGRSRGEPRRTPPIIWLGVVAEAATGKTELVNTILKPLRKQEKKRYETYETQKRAYQEKLQEYERRQKKKGNRGDKDQQTCTDLDEPPVEPKFISCLVVNATVEGLACRFRDCPEQSVLECRDELAGWFKGHNQYKKGQGNDREIYLEMFSGHGGCRLRAGSVESQNYMPGTSLSIVGGMTPASLKSCLPRNPEEDSDGLWSRFLLISLPMLELEFQQTDITLDGLLDKLYQHLRKLGPQNFSLSEGAEKVFLDWYEKTRQMANKEASPFFRPLWRRSRDQVSRFALIAHCVEYAAQGRSPAKEVSETTMKGAVMHVSFCVEQAIQTFSEIGINSADLTTERIKNFAEKYNQKEVEWKMVRTFLPKRSDGSRENKKTCCDFMKSVCKEGLASSLKDDFSIIKVISSESEQITKTEFPPLKTGDPVEVLNPVTNKWSNSYEVSTKRHDNCHHDILNESGETWWLTNASGIAISVPRRFIRPCNQN